MLYFVAAPAMQGGGTDFVLVSADSQDEVLEMFEPELHSQIAITDQVEYALDRQYAGFAVLGTV